MTRDFTVSPQEDDKTTVKIEPGTTKTLEPGSPVIKKETGSEDRQTLRRRSAIEVKVQEEEKLKYPPPYVFFKKTTWTIIIIMVPGPQVLQ